MSGMLNQNTKEECGAMISFLVMISWWSYCDASHEMLCVAKLPNVSMMSYHYISVIRFDEI